MPNATLVGAVAVGVGVFLVIAMLRILFRIPLNRMLIVFYILVFALALFVPEDFLAIAFDSGGVTTGPMTVPFIMALGVGVASIRSDENAAQDSFGLVALCSVGPILAVMVLALIYPGAGVYTPVEIPSVTDSRALWHLVSGGTSGVSQRSGGVSGPHRTVLRRFSGGFPEIKEEKSIENCHRHPVYLCGFGPVSYGRQRGLHAGRPATSAARSPACPSTGS